VGYGRVAIRPALVMVALVAGGCASSGHAQGGPATNATPGPTAPPGSTTPASGQTTTASGQTTTVPPVGALNADAGNPWFPLIDGATWTYEDVGGPGGSYTQTNHITGITRSAGATTVSVDISVNSRVLPIQYQVDQNGNVHVQLSAGPLGLSGSGNGSSLIIPNASGIFNCTPCRFSANFTTSLPGMPSLSFELTERVTSAGQSTINDSFDNTTYSGVQHLHVTFDATPAAGGPPVQVTTTLEVYLARGIGIVEEGGGTATNTVAGQVLTAPTGTLYLKSYLP
jgi:hypothetical protein